MTLPPASYTFLRDLANCPHKAYRKHVKKDIPFVETPELKEGIQVHKLLDEYLRRGHVRLPVNLEALAKPLKDMGARSEQSLGMDIGGGPVSFWAAPWARGKVDVSIIRSGPEDCADDDSIGDVGLIVDWKTGKVREDPKELQFHAMLLKANHPSLVKVMGCYAWIAENRMGPLHDLSAFERCRRSTAAFMARAREYELADDWPKTENPLCGWCDVMDCEFNKKG